MSCTQLKAYPLTIIPRNRYTGNNVSRSHVNFSRAYIDFPKLSLAVAPRTTKLRQHGPICVIGYNGKSGIANEDFPRNALEKGTGDSKKELSIEEQLKQTIAKKEYYKEEGNIGGGRGGGGRGGGGGGSSGGGDGESEDGGISKIVGEVVQVIFATLGFVFLYIFIIDGEDIARLAKDFIKFIFSGKKSIRLQRVFNGWSKFLQHVTKMPELEENWLENSIINTSTWYDGPIKYKRVLMSYLGSKANDFADALGLETNDDGMDSRSDDNDDVMGSRSDYDDDDQ